MSFIKSIVEFYLEGFRSMTIGRKLWMIIIIKLFIMFFILKVFFFQNFLASKFTSDTEKSNYITDQLTK